MKVKFDENLDARLVAPLRDDGHEVDTVRDQGLLGVADLSGKLLKGPYAGRT